MASTKREARQGEVDDASSTVSGMRVERERETTPAPANTSEEWDSLPSARPTSVPDYDVAALAFETSLRHHKLPSLPLDLAVPRRTRATPPDDLDLRASFLLLHIDGHASVRDIADLTTIPVEEVLTSFLGLSAQGLVELGGNQIALAVPVSGERRKVDVGDDPERG